MSQDGRRLGAFTCEPGKPSVWMSVTPNLGEVINPEGATLKTMSYARSHNRKQCEDMCDRMQDCNSITICPNTYTCDLHSTIVQKNPKIKKVSGGCQTWFKCKAVQEVISMPVREVLPPCADPKQGQHTAKLQGKAWSESDALIIKAKIWHMFDGLGQKEIGQRLDKAYQKRCIIDVPAGTRLDSREAHVLKPPGGGPGCNFKQQGAAGFDPPKALRLTFHDCLKYKLAPTAGSKTDTSCLVKLNSCHEALTEQDCLRSKEAHHGPCVWAQPPEYPTQPCQSQKDAEKHGWTNKPTAFCQDCGGGCDGCLNFHGMFTRHIGDDPTRWYPTTGDNDDLAYTGQALELLYTDPNFPSGTPKLHKSMKQKGYSRADLWAFAGLVAIENGFVTNDLMCPAKSDYKAPLEEVNGHKMSDGTMLSHSLIKALNPTKKCEVGKPFMQFWTGRQDCPAGWKGQTDAFEAEVVERHPDAQMSGKMIVDWFHDNFGPSFTPKDVVAVMGGHGIGSLHSVSMFSYTWTRTQSKSLNNEYYMNLAEVNKYMLSGVLAANDVIGKYITTPSWRYVWQTGVGGAGGRAPWRPIREKHRRFGGPFCWTHIFEMCPICYKMKNGQWKNRGIKLKGGYLDNAFYTDACCNTCYRDKKYDPKCMTWGANDEMGLNTDVGLYYKFDITPYGKPTGCSGMSQDDWNNEARWETNVDPPRGGANMRQSLNCPKQDIDAGDGTHRQLWQVVEAYANDMSLWVQDFAKVMEKVQSNGYYEGELTKGPDVFNQYTTCGKVGNTIQCTKSTSKRADTVSGGPQLGGMPPSEEGEVLPDQYEAVDEVGLKEATDCLDVTEARDPLCYGNVSWAKQTGIYVHPDYYVDYPTLTADSSDFDFQYVLWQKNGPGAGLQAGQGWGCPKPCTSSFDVLPSEEVLPDVPAEKMVSSGESEPVVVVPEDVGVGSEEKEKPQKGMPSWVWILLAVAGLLILGGAAVGLYVINSGSKKKPQKKKRSVRASPREEPAAEPAPATNSRTLALGTEVAPVLMAQPMQSFAYAQAPVAQAVPTYAPAPVQAAPAPVQTAYAVPQQAMYAAAPQQAMYAPMAASASAAQLAYPSTQTQIPVQATYAPGPVQSPLAPTLF